MAGWGFRYDLDSRMTSETLWGYVYGTTATYPLGRREVQYDKAGRRTRQAFKSANRTGYLNLDTTQTYSYDSTKKWLSGIARQGSANESASYTYDPANGRLTRMDYGNGAHTDYTYYGSGAVKKISHLSTTGTLIASAEYDYDLAGNVLSVVLDDSLRYSGDATVSYSYDDLHRLTEETCVPSSGSYRVPYHYKYSYDAVGNRTGKTIGSGIGRLEITYSYSVRNELVDEDTYVVIWNEEEQEEEWVYLGGWSYAYDLRGNMVRKGDPEGHWWWEYTWSADDKLLKMEFIDDYGSEGPRTKVEYKYDLLGRRIAKRLTPPYGSPGPWRWYFYDGLQVTAEGTGTTDKMYYTHSPSAIGGIISRDNNGTKLFYHYDRLGNVMAVTDSNGNPYAEYTMEAFGSVMQKGTSTGYYSQHATDPQPYHLTTKEYDPDTGLYYFNARWYDASVGRFVSQDPVYFLSYDYVSARPTYYADPRGLCFGEFHKEVTQSAVRDLDCDILGCVLDYYAGSTDRRYPTDYEFGLAGHHCFGIGERLIIEMGMQKVRDAGCDPKALGDALHFLQDCFAHYGLSGKKGHDPIAHDILRCEDKRQEIINATENALLKSGCCFEK